MLLKDLSQQKLLSHSGRCFDVRFSPDGNDILSASEDGTAKLWDVKSRKAVLTFKHNVESEVLRAAFLNSSSTLVATCGADGFAMIWKTYYDSDVSAEASKVSDKSAEASKSGSAQVVSSNSAVSTSVSNLTGKRRLKKEITLTHGVAQIYACESFDVSNDSSSAFMTAADSSVYLWDLNSQNFKASDNTSSHVWTVSADSDSRSSSPSSDSGAQGYGGPRNPDNDIYIFDAKINPQQQNVIGLALSDGNIRQIDIRSAGFVSSDSTAAPFTPLQNTNFPQLRSQICKSSNSCNNGDGDLPFFESISLTGAARGDKAVGNAHATSVCYSDDGVTLLAALGSGDVAVLDLRMGGVRTLLRSHTRTCYGAVFSTSSESLKSLLNNDNKGRNSGSSSGVVNSTDCNEEELKNKSAGESSDVTESTRIDQLRLHDESANSTTSNEQDSSSANKSGVNRNLQCLTWSSDCSVRSWDLSVDGLCTRSTDEVIIPDFPIFSFAVNGQRKREFACGGGNGDASFVGTPIHLFYDAK